MPPNSTTTLNDRRKINPAPVHGPKAVASATWRTAAVPQPKIFDTYSFQPALAPTLTFLLKDTVIHPMATTSVGNIKRTTAKSKYKMVMRLSEVSATPAQKIVVRFISFRKCNIFGCLPDEETDLNPSSLISCLSKSLNILG